MMSAQIECCSCEFLKRICSAEAGSWLLGRKLTEIFWPRLVGPENWEQAAWQEVGGTVGHALDQIYDVGAQG